MKEGRISEPVWKRSVLRRIENRREEVLSGPATGRAGNLLDIGEGTALSCEAGFLSSAESTDTVKERILFHRAVNACAAMGAEPVAVQVQLLCHADFTEVRLQELFKALEGEAKAQSVSLLPGKIEVSAAVKAPYLTLSAVGKRKNESFVPYQRMQAGQEILVSKWIALEGTVLLIREHRQELLSRFTPVFVTCAEGFSEHMSSVLEAAMAVKHGVSAMLPIEEGGIFGALWELAAGAGLGLEVQAEKIPIRQETIEICEPYHKNPYLLPSAGSLLLVTEEGERLRAELAAANIPSAVIGRLTDGRDRVLLHGEEKRFLELPKMNELNG